MKKLVPREKMSKKARREIDQAKRMTWGDIKPVTRTVESAKRYNRKKNRRTDDVYTGGSFFVVCV